MFTGDTSNLKKKTEYIEKSSMKELSTVVQLRMSNHMKQFYSPEDTKEIIKIVLLSAIELAASGIPLHLPNLFTLERSAARFVSITKTMSKESLRLKAAPKIKEILNGESNEFPKDKFFNDTKLRPLLVIKGIEKEREKQRFEQFFEDKRKELTHSLEGPDLISKNLAVAKFAKKLNAHRSRNSYVKHFDGLDHLKNK